ncbi:MAG: hypothetical protein HFH03_02430 [Dorea sp.]|jgi:hypothetical protein|nr:hypothetical protein [Dorea sp.]
MDIQYTANKHIITTNPAAQNPPKPLIPVPPSQQGTDNLTGSGQEIPVDGQFAELEASLEEIRAGETILNAALAKEEEIAKNQKQQDRAELESTKDDEYTDPDKEAANARILDRKLSEMLHWKYDSSLSVQGNLNHIHSIFQSLLKDILSNYTGSLQLQLMAQLDALTLNALRQLVTEHFQELLEFLGQYGRPDSGEALINGLFENMAERKPLTSQNQNPSFGGTGSFAQNLDQKGSGQKLTQGVIYQRDTKARINTQYQSFVGKSERSATRAAEVLQRGGYLTGGKVFTLRDIRQAQNFIQYMNQNFLQTKPEKLPYTSEEYLGFSAGMSSLKAQTFIEQAGLKEGTASALKYAIGIYAQEYFFQNAQSLKQTPEYRNQSLTPAYQADSFQKIYRYMIDSYNENHDARSAALAGLKKSLESFYGKQTDPVYQNLNRYRSDIGFFTHSPSANMKEEILNGWKAICRDWNAFLQYTQLSKNKALKFDYNLSRDYYMAFLLSQEKSPHSGKIRKKKAAQFVIRLSILIVGIIICLFLLALFS